jgi:quercetin dioxygenase-like cupin family protein
VVVAGNMELTVDGSTRTVRPGDTYFVPSGVPHGAVVEAGSRVIEIFAEQRFHLDDQG